MTSGVRDDVPAMLARARAGEPEVLGELFERFRNYLSVLARVQIGRRLQRKVEEADLVQETFLEAHRAFPRFRGGSEGELAYWLRQILAARLAMLVRHYFGTQQRDVNLERELSEALTATDGLPVSPSVRFTAQVAPTIESIGTIVVGVLLAIGLVLGIVRTVRRGQSARRGARTEAEAGTSTSLPVLGGAAPDDDTAEQETR